MPRLIRAPRPADPAPGFPRKRLITRGLSGSRPEYSKNAGSTSHTGVRAGVELIVLSYTAGRWDLLVIPPETIAAAAAHFLPMNEVTMQPRETPSAGRAEVRIVAASPEAARRVAEVLRRCFAGAEQRSYPAGADGGTRLHLTVDTTHTAEPARSWLLASRSSGQDPTQTDEV